MRLVVSILLLFLSALSFGQKEANVWYFGANAGLDFNTSPPTALTDGELNTLEGCSSFSDPDGNLLFYSDGITVWDKEHVIMTYTNGNDANDLKGNPSSTQSGMIIPKPGATTIYYLFTVDDGPNFGNPGLGFNVYTIDISLNGGLGQLIDEDNDGVFFTDLSDGRANGWTEKVTAVRGKECETYWVISVVGNNFYAYKVDVNGVNLTPVLSTVTNTSARRGYLKVSPDGTKIAIANQLGGSTNVYVYSFDAQTGDVANDGVYIFNGFDGGQAYGVEFSRSSKKLYISTVSGFRSDLNDFRVDYQLFQFDVDVDNFTDTANIDHIKNSITLIHEQIANSTDFEEGGFRGALQLGPDGKIYATIPLAYSNGFASHLDVIENPNAEAEKVVFTKDAINLNGAFSTQGLPPFISSLLLPIEIKDNDTGQVINDQDLQFCVGETKNISPDPITGSNIVYIWTFNDGASTTTIGNTRELSLTNLSAANSGSYVLTVQLTDDCGIVTELEGVFNIDVYPVPLATQPNDTNFCDTNNTGFNTFDFKASKTTAILNGQDPAIFEVVYFTDLADANANTNAISDTSYTNPTAFSNQTIYARVHNILAPDACFVLTDFMLTVTGLPVAQKPTDYEICDDTSVGSDTDGFITGFVLSTKDAEILGSLSASQYTVSYHRTKDDATNNTNPIDKVNPFQNTTANTQTIYIRVENKDNTNCFDGSKELELVVSPLPTVTASVDLKQCDNDTDGFSNFNLFEAASKISTNHANETFVFYPNIDAANADTDAYTINESTAFTNRNQTTDTVWVRTISDFGCYRVSEVNLTVSTTGIPATFQQRVFTVCDDFLDEEGNDNVLENDDTDGIATFDFSSVTAEIIAIFPASQLLIVTYYRNEADALAEQNSIEDPSAYRNIGYANTQQIYVRVDSQLDNDCLGFGAHITLHVDPDPTSSIPDNLELCDDFDDGNGTNGIVQTFNLSSQNSTILGGQNPADFTVSYHLTAPDANTGANPIANPSMFENTTRDLQTIYVRVENNSTSCFNDHVSFDLIVHPLPIANFVEDLEICDDDTDGSARNGFSQSFDLELQTEGILGTQDPANYTVTYHSSLSDAQNNLLPLGSPFTNTVANRQTIYVRVFNETTQCANGISNFDVIVNPEPFTEVISNLSYCDDDVDQDDTNGFVQQIDLDSQILPILGTTQNEADFKVTFHLSNTDASTGDNALSSPFENTIAGQQTIYVRVEDLRTGCVNDDLTFDLIVNPLPSFEVVTPRIVCLNGPELKIGAEIPGAVYTYEWLAPDGTITTDRTLIVSSGGLYTITATTTDGTGCSRTETVQVNESIIATITEEDITVIDDSENNSISIDNSNNNLGIGDYEFALLDAEGTIVVHYQDEPLFEGLDGGIYRVLVRDKNGCGVASVEVPVVTFPKFFTPNNDGYNDTWSLKGVNTTFFPTSKIYIFDRYGKVVADIPIGTAWDGTYGGKRLPSNDYWFNVILVDSNGNTRRRTGNFSLLRK